MTIRARIRELRKEAGLSQQELARRLGASQSTISAWERRDSGVVPGGNLLVELCKEFGTSPRYILRGEGPRHAQPDARLSELIDKLDSLPSYSREAQLLARDLDTLTDERQRRRAYNAAIRAIEWVRGGRPTPTSFEPSPEPEADPRTPGEGDPSRPSPRSTRQPAR